MTGADFVCLEAPELPHRPSEKRQIDVPEHRRQCRRRVAPVVFYPPPEERVELAGDVGQRQLRPLSDVQVPDRRPHGFQCRRTDRGCEAAKQFPVSRAPDQPRSESVAEEVEPDVRICPFALSILAVDDLSWWDAAPGGIPPAELEAR